MGYFKGHTTYHSTILKEGYTAQQRYYAFSAFGELFKKTVPSRVLEIGTSFGGTTQFIREKLNELHLESSEVRSYDVNEKKWYDKQRNTGIDIRIENIFSKSYKELINPDDVKEFIAREGTTIVLCDGGSKKDEFRLLAQFLKRGDIIMAHDYIDTQENFTENYYDKIWNWREIGIEHIQPVCDEYSLVPFMQEEFNEAVWACRKKI
jgi:cephalosporin hydroxylase